MAEDTANDADLSMKKFDLYIKASAIDRETKGSCPICQQFFMITCLLGESQDDIDFKVFTVQAECPPKYFADGWSKKYPVVMVNSGRNKKSVDISGLMYDTFEELEDFFDGIINDDNKVLKRNNTPNQTAMKVVQNLYKYFNHYIASDPAKNPGPEKTLRAELKKLNEYLESMDFLFMVDNVLAFADCHLLPRLQHIRVAGKAYHNFEIPKEYSYIWRYLKRAYAQDAFKSTMPSDQDIIFHYLKKATKQPRINGKPMGNPTLAQFTYTNDVPDENLQALDSEDRDEDLPKPEEAPAPPSPTQANGNSEDKPSSPSPTHDNNGSDDATRTLIYDSVDGDDAAAAGGDGSDAKEDDKPASPTPANGAVEDNGSVGSGSTNDPAD